MEATRGRVEEEFAAFGQAFEDHRTRFEANFMSETQALGGTLAKLGKEIETLKASAYENVEGKLEAFEDQLMGDLSEKKSMAFRQLDSWLSDMEKTISGIVSEAGVRRSAEETKYKDEFHAHMVKLRDDLHGQLDKLSKNIEAVRDNVLNQHAAALKELEENAPRFEG